MEISQGLLGALFSLSAVTGAGLGVLWSLIRLLRGICGADRRGWHTVPVRILLTGTDVLFGVLCGVALILLLYYVNDGQFRLLAVLGLGCGFFAWYHTLGRLLGALTDRLSAWLHAALRRLSVPLARRTGCMVRRLGKACHAVSARIQRRRSTGECSETDANVQDQTE